MSDASQVLYGDEGMWLTNDLPFERIKKLHGVELPKDFGERVQRAAVRMNNGGSASFVSSEGLIITNHHVARELVSDLSTKDKDYLKDGFYARQREDELKVSGAEVNVLDSIEDVTARVVGAQTRSAEIATIEREAKQGIIVGEVVTLYQGGRYHLYRYRRYNDVRLVFTPEAAIASYGGDFDNYEFPRYDLDITFFRIYDAKGNPVVPDEYFRFSPKVLTGDELIFVAGHPGRTDRLTTLAAIKDMRDRALPERLAVLRRLEITLQQYGGRSPEAARQMAHELQVVQNLRKRYMGQLAALQDPSFMQRVEEREETIRAGVATQNPWTDIEKALALYATLFRQFDIFESMIGFGGHYDKPNPHRPLKGNWTKYLAIARVILRMTEESTKPDRERLSEYTDAHRESMLEKLYAALPIYNELEITQLADALSYTLETFGAEDETVKAILADKGPHERARELVQGTMLGDPEARRSLVEGGKKAVDASTDPMILLARVIDGRARAVRMRVEKEVQEVLAVSYGKIAEALFELYGDQVYPDATFTLRLAYGTMKPFMRDGAEVPSQTTIAGILPHGAVHDFIAPWQLPSRWEERGEWIASCHTPMNFIATHDSHGGNSGSPVFRPDFTFVGILFDGIMEGQGSTFVYGDYERSVSVSAAGILEILKNIYQANALVSELLT